MKISKLTWAIAALLVLGLSACKKNTMDVTELLKSVPSSSAGVVVFNLEEMLEEAGCKVKDHKIEPGKELQKIISSASIEHQKEIASIFDGNSGIEPKGAVVFYDSNRTYLTFSLYDETKFCEMISSQRNASFKEETSGVKICENVAVKGTQAWICLSSTKIDADAIAGYSSLVTSQSFLVTSMGEKLLVDENDIRGWALIDTFSRQMLDKGRFNALTLGLGFFYEDAESVEFKVDFDEGEMELEAMVLNSKGKPAKYQLPAEKIDVATLKGIGGTCDAMMAFTINEKLIKKLDKVSPLLANTFFGKLTETFKNIDGTIGIVVAGAGSTLTTRGVVTTKGDVSPSLSNVISENLGSISIDGKYLRFSKGDTPGKLDVEKCAEDLKGCCVGIVGTTSEMKSFGIDPGMSSDFDRVAIKLKPESGSMEFEIEIKTTNPKENSILTFLRNM